MQRGNLFFGGWIINVASRMKLSQEDPVILRTYQADYSIWEVMKQLHDSHCRTGLVLDERGRSTDSCSIWI